MIRGILKTIICLLIFVSFLNKIEADIESIMAEMTVEEKIGQLLMVGIKGKAVNAFTKNQLEKLKVGGIILYSHNVDNPVQLKEFTNDLQRTAKKETKLPLFIAVDQEGGPVTRIRQHLHVLPAAMALGATQSPQLSYLAGKLTAYDLSLLGVNMNLAPVLDILTNEKNQVIGIRSFGDNPELVSQMGMWYIEGLQSKGVVATAKHFPGHGNTDIDSHYALPHLEKDLKSLEAFQLTPFQNAIDNGLDAMMTAHISVPTLDPSGLPATLSYNLLTNLIRNKMNFKGIVITDDLEMKSIMDHYDIETAAVKSVLAGADMVMIGWTEKNKERAFYSLRKAFQEGLLTQERIDQSVMRILSLKQKRGLFEIVNKKSFRLVEQLEHRMHEKVATQIAEAAVTVTKNEGKIFPLKQDDPRRVLLISSVTGLYRKLKFFHDKLDFMHMEERPTLKEMVSNIKKITQKSAGYDALVFGLTHESQIGLINRMLIKIDMPIAVISLSSPYYLKQLSSKAEMLMCSFGTQPELLQATAKVLMGIIPSKGKLPVVLESHDKILSEGDKKTTISRR